MAILLELAPEHEARLRERAARTGQTVEELAREAVMASACEPVTEEPDPFPLEKRRAALALLEGWRNAPPDLDEAEGYPTEFAPFGIRVPSDG